MPDVGVAGRVLDPLDVLGQDASTFGTAPFSRGPRQSGPGPGRVGVVRVVRVVGMVGVLRVVGVVGVLRVVGMVVEVVVFCTVQFTTLLGWDWTRPSAPKSATTTNCADPRADTVTEADSAPPLIWVLPAPSVVRTR